MGSKMCVCEEIPIPQKKYDLDNFELKRQKIEKYYNEKSYYMNSSIVP